MLVLEESSPLWQRDDIYITLAFGGLTYSHRLPGGYEIEAKKHWNGREQGMVCWNFRMKGLSLEWKLTRIPIFFQMRIALLFFLHSFS